MTRNVRIFTGFSAALAIAATLVLAGCDVAPPSADQVQRSQQERMSAQSNSVVGMPAITNFFEKRQFKRILEMRDDPKLQTYTYTRDFNGKLHLVCNSIGFPIPGATQYTNPSKLASEYQYPTNGTNTSLSSTGVQTLDGVLPQADPNGLYSPSSMDATWVICQNPSNPNEIAPQYNENKLEVFLWPKKNAVIDE